MTTQHEIEGIIVDVDIRAGLPSLTIVGLADRATWGAVERLRDILPPMRVTVNVHGQHGPHDAAELACRAVRRAVAA